VKEKREKQEIKFCLERKIKRKKVFFLKKKRKMKNKICKRERKEQEK
jgi:hypothetical protein